MNEESIEVTAKQEEKKRERQEGQHSNRKSPGIRAK